MTKTHKSVSQVNTFLGELKTIPYTVFSRIIIRYIITSLRRFRLAAHVNLLPSQDDAYIYRPKVMACDTPLLWELYTHILILFLSYCCLERVEVIQHIFSLDYLPVRLL